MGFQNFESVEIDNVYSPVNADTYNPMMLEGVAKQVERLADSLSGACGCSYEVYLGKFSYLVDELIANVQDEAQRATILYVAREHDYLSREEVEEMQDSCIDNGLCIHGIDPDCCPAGCGG